MAVVSVAGAAFTVDLGNNPVSDQITNGTITTSPTIVRTPTLGDISFVQTDLNTTVSLEFLYDENTGVFDTLQTAIAAGNSVDLDIRSATGHWAGPVMYVESCEATFEATGVATCTASFTGTMTFS
ncbi:MAG: hypothetical protein ACO3IN_10830 [Steroidobacteraceae bacterium]|jgi:hypothetical protein